MGKFTILPALTIYFASSMIMILFAEQVCLCKRIASSTIFTCLKIELAFLFQTIPVYLYVNYKLENLDLNNITKA